MAEAELRVCLRKAVRNGGCEDEGSADMVAGTPAPGPWLAQPLHHICRCLPVYS